MTEIERLQRENAELREAIIPLLPYLECDDFEITATIDNDSRAPDRVAKLTRDAAYMDFGSLRRIGRRMIAKSRSSGA